MRSCVTILDRCYQHLAATRVANDSDDQFQALLAKSPQILLYDNTDSSMPIGWILVSRKKQVGNDSESDRYWDWGLDHLLLDHDAIPTMVRVMRRRRPYLWREVASQMLESAYKTASNWSIERFQLELENSKFGLARNWGATLNGGLQTVALSGRYLRHAMHNLHVGQLRIVFVADEIPSEIRNIAEFLNEALHPAEVVALEVKQYIGPDKCTPRAPRVVWSIGGPARSKTISKPPNAR